MVTNNLGTFWQDRARDGADQAEVLEFVGRAEAAFRESLALREQSDGPESVRVATVCNNLAMLLAMYGRPAEALPMAERAVAIRERVSGPDHPDTIKALNTLGGCMHRTKGARAAVPILAEAKDRARRRVGMDPKIACITELSWCAMLGHADLHEEALAAAATLWPRVVQLWGEHSERARGLARSTARVAEELGRPDDAATWAARARPAR